MRVAVVRRFVEWLVVLAQVLVPPRRDQVAWMSHPDHVGNAFHLFRHVVTTRHDLRHVWLVADADAAEAIRADFARWEGAGRGHTLHVKDRHGPAGAFALLRSRCSFHTHGVPRWMTRAVRRECVSLWHGMPIKAIGALNTRSPNPHPTFGTLHVATTEHYQAVIGRAFHAPPDEVLLTRLPRCDVLGRPHEKGPDAASIRARLGLPEDGPLVLWLPTYRTPGHLRDAQDGVLGYRTFLDDLAPGQAQELLAQVRRVGAHLVLKPHPDDPVNRAGEQALDRAGLEGIHVITAAAWLEAGIELYDALAHVDGLVSDVSSVLLDWLETTRPLGLLGFDPDTYTRDVVVDVDALWASPRVHRLDLGGGPATFADDVAATRPMVPDPALADLVTDPDAPPGCETVLAATTLRRARRVS